MSNIQNTNTPPLAVGLPEASRLLGISRSGLYRAINAGDLRHVKAGRRTLLRTVDLETYLQRLQAQQLGGAK
jgi:excisionase family DNA binding protein